MVYLVGAGPGDPGLITVKAIELLRRADVVLYDRLIDASLLSNTKEGCTLIDVGKSADNHTKTQDEIADMLADFGKKGLETVRLKGGDPFLFGRGGEEAERLRREGIPFEIVPGVSALTAAPAYAGIPLTHRSFASSVGIVTGHAASGKHEDTVRWSHIAQAVDTIVVFMGVGNLAHIAEELRAGGLPADTPAALIEQGTTPSQKVVTGSLADIHLKAEEQNVSPPALLVVGKTVALHETLAWFCPHPLAGLRIGITRPQRQSKQFSDKLRELGAEPVLMPAITTVDTIDTPEVLDALGKLPVYDAILFFSVNGVESFFRALKNMNMDSELPAGKMIGAIGPATAQSLLEHGISADVKAEAYIAEGLLDAICEHTDPAAKHFLLVRSDRGRSYVPDGLRSRGATVDEVTFYSTQPERMDTAVLDRVRKGGIDIVTFTSASTVDGFFDNISPDELPGNVILASIGPETTKAIGRYGLEPAVCASEYTTDGLIKALCDARGRET
ncbi:uroporphyrinogen-III C-methyltransferase [bacterium]|nr:uroporphyrinogen-III C-methyltransferase [bacterium]